VTDTRIVLNDGAANFTLAPPAWMARTITGYSPPTLLDVDRDGDLDLLFGATGDTAVDGYANDGSGRFTPRQWMDLRGSGRLLTADFDGDGDDDVLAAGSVFANGFRQLRAPLTARAGHPFELEFHARPGYGVLGKFAVLVVGWSRTSLVVPPLGRWLVAGPGSVLLPPLFLPPNTSHTLAFEIPALPHLIGTRMLAQALFVDLDGDSHFSGLVDEVIR
jgi:hypothetical protein